MSVAAATAPVAWAQRLGYLLEHVGASERAADLRAYVRAHARESTLLAPSAPHRKARRHEGWKLYVNADVKADV